MYQRCTLDCRVSYPEQATRQSLHAASLVDEKALQLGIEEYLRKPVDVDQFIAAIASRCGR